MLSSINSMKYYYDPKITKRLSIRIFQTYLKMMKAEEIEEEKIDIENCFPPAMSEEDLLEK